MIPRLIDKNAAIEVLLEAPDAWASNRQIAEWLEAMEEDSGWIQIEKGYPVQPAPRYDEKNKRYSMAISEDFLVTDDKGKVYTATCVYEGGPFFYYRSS